MDIRDIRGYTGLGKLIRSAPTQEELLARMPPTSRAKAGRIAYVKERLNMAGLLKMTEEGRRKKIGEVVAREYGEWMTPAKQEEYVEAILRVLNHPV